MTQAVRFFGPIGETTGYGTAVANFSKAFSNSNVPTKFNFGAKAQEQFGKIIGQLKHYDGPCQVDFYLHGPPWNRHKSLNYKIAYFYWEADTLPSGWTRSINAVQEIWAPCQLIRQACLKAGFRGTLKVVPTPIEEWKTDKKILIPSPHNHRQMVADDIYKFYSIFQWHERKGFSELLTSYWKTFEKNDRVILLIKTNPLNIGKYVSENIRNDIFKLKSKLNQIYYAPVYLMPNLVSKEHVMALHNTGDCYVSPHHGEGWGLPIVDAMYAGKQVITTQFGGITEYLNNESAHIIPHTMGPVQNMDWAPGLYNSHQKWAYPSINKLGIIMRDVYENHSSYILKPEKAKEIARNTSIDKVTEIINKEFEHERKMVRK